MAWSESERQLSTRVATPEEGIAYARAKYGADHPLTRAVEELHASLAPWKSVAEWQAALQIGLRDERTRKDGRKREPSALQSSKASAFDARLQRARQRMLEYSDDS